MTQGISRRFSWVAPVSVFITALVTYLLTAPAGLTWAHDSADGGELIAAALVGGVPHPPGYPVYMLLARLFVALPIGTPAWRVMLLSALSGALACAVVAVAVQQTRSLVGFPAGAGQISHQEPEASTTSRGGLGQRSWLLGSVPALGAGLLLASTPLLWSQATVAEVYALHALFAALLIWSLLGWQNSGKWMWGVAVGLIMGLAVGNHLTIVWLAPMVVVWLALGGRSRGGRKDTKRAIVGFLVALAIGLTAYAYLPLAAAGDPPVNWGNPQQVEGFLWLISGQLYKQFVLAVSAQDVVARLAAWARLLWREFLPWGMSLALLGVGWWIRRSRWIALSALFSFFLGLAWALGYDSSDSFLTLTPGWVLLAFWVGLGLTVVLAWLAQARAGWLSWAMLLIVVIAGVPLFFHWPAQDIHQDRRAEGFLDHVLLAIDPDALVITVGDRATFSLWYARYGLQRRPDVIPLNRDLWDLPFYRRTVALSHPALGAGTEQLSWHDLVRSALAQRPVYVVSADGTIPGTSLFGKVGDGSYNWIATDANAPRSIGPEFASWALWQLSSVAGE